MTWYKETLVFTMMGLESLILGSSADGDDKSYVQKVVVDVMST
jgi:hypothetical protein